MVFGVGTGALPLQKIAILGITEKEALSSNSLPRNDSQKISIFHFGFGITSDFCYKIHPAHPQILKILILTVGCVGNASYIFSSFTNAKFAEYSI
jgi:hypothetical protein